MSQRSPAPSQTFHRNHGLRLSLTSPDLFAGVTGAAHFSTASTSPREATHSRHSWSHLYDASILEGKRKQTIDDVLEVWDFSSNSYKQTRPTAWATHSIAQLFCSRPTLEIFERSWRPHATFENPYAKCIGYPQFVAHWYSMPHLLSKSATISYDIVSSTHNPNRITYEQEQEYTIRGIGRKKVIKSLVVVELDDEDMIIHLRDMWNGGDLPTKWGLERLRRLTAMTLPWLVPVPKSKKNE